MVKANKDFRYTVEFNHPMSIGQKIDIITPEKVEVSGVVTKVVKVKGSYRWKVTLKTDKSLVNDNEVVAISSRGE